MKTITKFNVKISNFVFGDNNLGIETPINVGIVDYVWNKPRVSAIITYLLCKNTLKLLCEKMTRSKTIYKDCQQFREYYDVYKNTQFWVAGFRPKAESTFVPGLHFAYFDEFHKLYEWFTNCFEPLISEREKHYSYIIMKELGLNNYIPSSFNKLSNPISISLVREGGTYVINPIHNGSHKPLEIISKITQDPFIISENVSYSSLFWKYWEPIKELSSSSHELLTGIKNNEKYYDLCSYYSNRNFHCVCWGSAISIDKHVSQTVQKRNRMKLHYCGWRLCARKYRGFKGM